MQQKQYPNTDQKQGARAVAKAVLLTFPKHRHERIREHIKYRPYLKTTVIKMPICKILTV